MDKSIESLQRELDEMTAAVLFGTAMAGYVKEVDYQLWKRAREYALDYCTKIEGVQLSLFDPKENKE